MKTNFGMTPKGQETYLYTLENEKIKASFTDYGAAMVSLIEKKTNTDVVLGFDCCEDYCAQDAYIGASVGRTANRIGNGRFTLNGQEYQLYINNGPNCNHGGLEGFDKKVWQTEEMENAVRFFRTSPDGEEGYPGNLDVSVTYRLLDNGVEITAEGTSDRDTLFAYTNHSYFNCDGSDCVLDEQLMIPSSEYCINDPDGMATGVFESVIGTPFDFRTFHELGERIQDENIQLKEALGYDHFFPLEGEGIRLMAVLKGEKTSVTVYSDMPGIHVYTANYTNVHGGKYGRHYEPRCAAALEAEYCPNGINRNDGTVVPLVKAGKTLKNTIRYIVEPAL